MTTIIQVVDANGDTVYETEYCDDYGSPESHALAALEGIFEGEAISDGNRWFTDDGEVARWFEEEALDTLRSA